MDRAAGALSPALALLIAAQAWDAATFGVDEVLHAGVEGNPMMALAYARGGLAAVVLTKALATAVMLALVLVYRRRTGRGRWLALLAASVGVLGALSNVLALVGW